MKQTLISALVILALGAVIVAMAHRGTQQRAEIDRLRTNARAASEAIRSLRLADSASAAVIEAQTLTIDELETQRRADAAIIRQLKARPQDVRHITHYVSEIRDSVVYVARDSCIAYADKWVTFQACLRDRSLSYSVRDSVSALVLVSYRRRFLWWRWKPHYEAAIVNHNPHARILSAEAVKVIEQ